MFLAQPSNILPPLLFDMLFSTKLLAERVAL
jgi:hypothetical protein